MANIFSSSTLIAIVVLLLFYFKLHKKARKQNSEDSAYAGIWWFCVFISAFALYLIAFFQVPQTETQTTFSYILYTITISAETSIRMFVYNFNYEDVRSIADNNIIYCAAVIACFISASLWTTIMAKNIFFKGIANEFKVRLHAILPLRKGKYHYIIVGCEKSMRTFLSDLEKSVSKNHITIITGETVEKGFNSTVHYKELVEKGFAVINGKADETALNKAGINNTKRKTRVIAITECDEQNLNVADIITQKIFFIIFSGSEYIKKYADIELKQRAVEALSFKITSETESTNDERTILKKHIENALGLINLEAHIMYSFIERTEHFAFAENAYGKVDFFNPYELRVRNFFWHHPVTSLVSNFIDNSKARLVGELKSDRMIYKKNGQKYIIKNIFVGFGSANFQMLKGSVLTGQLFGCDYNAVVYDEKIFADTSEKKPSVLQAMFMNYSSGLFPGGDQTIEGEKYLQSPKEKYNIVFKNGNVLTRDFYADMKNEILNNDFTTIYIALGEDKLSIETACEIRQYLYEHGIRKDKLRIFVKICEASVFNRDLVINNPQNIPIDIECFGLNDSIYTKDYIINESLDKFARIITNKNHETPWEFLTETKRDINRQVAMATRIKLQFLGFDLADKDTNENLIGDDTYYNSYVGIGNIKISEIIRLSKEIAKLNKEIEILNERLKKDSKKQLELARENKELKKNLENLKDKRSDFILDYVVTENGQTDGAISDTPRNNLAMLEHLRWNTFHLVHGWTKKPISTIGDDNSGRQDRLTKQHACITTFEEMIELRKLQAKKMCEKNPNTIPEKAQAKADTIWYDYNLMDELVIRLQATDKILIKL